MHKGFTITPAPKKEPGGWRLAATIEKDGKTNQLIRADVIADKSAATEASLTKARQVIDQMGARLFDG